MADFINHLTKVNDILWYIDEMYLTDNTSVNVKGWISHPTQTIKEFVIGGSIYPITFISRPDVKEYYPYLPTDMVGFEINIHIKEVTQTFGLILTDDSQIEDIGTLEKWGVFNSGFNSTLKKGIVVVDNFYQYPDWVRLFAMKNLNFTNSDYHRGKRSTDRFILNGTKEKFEEILGKKIINWNHEAYANGIFQYCTAQDPIVYHVDTQTYAAMVYLTPDAPLNSGTSTFKSKLTGATRFDNIENNNSLYTDTFKGVSNELNFYDKSTFELVDSVANVYNRLVMFDSKAIHAATEYFGDAIENARFFHLFFFDIEW